MVLKATLVNNLQTIDGIRAALGKQADVKILFQVNRSNLWRVLRDGIYLKKRVVTNKVDLVHQFWGGVASLINALILPCKFCIALLGSDLFGEYSTGLTKTTKGKILKIGSRLTAKVADAVIVMSEKMKQELPSSVHQKCTIIPEGVDLDRFEPIDNLSARAMLKLSPNKEYILFFDNGNSVKNSGFAHQVIGGLVKRRSDLELLVISRANPVENELLKFYYSSANLLLVTSLHEGSNNSIKEALACNCPVVSSNTGDAEERMEQVYPGRVIEGWKLEDYIAACNEILDVAIRSNGRENLGEVTVQVVSSKVASLYDRLIGNA